MSFRSSVAGFFVLLAVAPSMFAATFVVPTDRDLVRRAHGIVIATALPSYSRAGSDTAVETVTPMQIEETIKGRFGSTIDVVEPGGTYGGTSMVIAGVPQFETGQRMLLFLANTGKDRWAVTELVLGKFTFSKADNGEQLLVRDEDEIVGWDPNLQPHVEGRRSADRFLRFVRAETAGGMVPIDYFTSSAPVSTTTSRTSATQPALMTTYSATSYTMVVSGSMGSRWTVFPSAVNWYTGMTTEPGAPNGGVTAAQTGIASWDNDCPSNVNYVYGGVDNGTHTQGLHAPDGANTILFERDLSTWGVSPFSCSSSGYSGTLGIGGVTSASGTNTLNGETFATTQEGDVEMNRGIANCTLLFGNGDFNSAVTHELGHTLGFRHSDQTRSGSAACSTDPSLECSSSAIMTAFVTANLNGALTAWDQHAVDALYPGGSCTTCTSPSITSQPQSTTTSGNSVTLSVGATGTAPLSYQWYVGTSGNTGSPIAGATSSSVTVAPGSTTSYWVRVSNSCGSANSATATVTVSTTGGTKMKVSTADFNGDAKSDVFWRRQNTTGQDAIWLMNGTTKAVGAYTETASTNWHVVGIGDFDGDGKADVLTRDPATGQNAMWLMNGTTKALGVIIESAPTQWDVVGIGDFDGDGKADIFWRNHNTGEDSIWLMSGTAKRVGAYTDTMALNWKFAGVGDFNGDGRADAVWRDPATGQNVMWLMNGTTKSVGAIIESAPTQWDIAGAGDFDGDGKWDIFWRNHSTGENSIWLMNGTTKAVGAYTDPAGLNWTVAAIGDYDGDGKSDVFLRDYSNGNNSMWLMSGTTKRVGSYLESADTSWRIVP